MANTQKKEKQKEVQKEVQTKKRIVSKKLGFVKRNYFIGDRNVLLVAGQEVDEETYNLFNDHCKKVFFGS